MFVLRTTDCPKFLPILRHLSHIIRATWEDNLPRRFVTKKLELFALHGRTGSGPVNYRNLFDKLEETPKRKRILERGDRLIALPVVRVSGSDCFFVAYEGPIGLKPLIFNSGNAEERIGQMDAKEVVATRTHGLVDLVAREAFVEYNQRGAKVADIQELIMVVLAPFQGWGGLNLQLHPMADQEFMDAVDKFSRIRVASVKLARPNVDWTDDYNHFTAMAHESEAGVFEISAYAERGGSLSKKRGLLGFMKHVTSHKLPAVQNAQVIGNRLGEEAETRVSLEHFIRHRRVKVPVDNDGHVITTEMRDQLRQFAEERRRDRRGK